MKPLNPAVTVCAGIRDILHFYRKWKKHFGTNPNSMTNPPLPPLTWLNLYICWVLFSVPVHHSQKHCVYRKQNSEVCTSNTIRKKIGVKSNFLCGLQEFGLFYVIGWRCLADCPMGNWVSLRIYREPPAPANSAESVDAFRLFFLVFGGKSKGSKPCCNGI